MKLLIIGGTRFLGRHLVEVAIAHQHEVTLFNRGHHSSIEFPNVEMIRGDRHVDLDLLQGRQWDAVIDTCGYLPRAVKASAEVMAGEIDHYILISSMSADADLSVSGVDETASLQRLTTAQLQAANEIDTSGQVSAMTYGELYGLCDYDESAHPCKSVFSRG